jgi:hypothetical protein
MAGRVFFALHLPTNLIAGGVRTIFRHAEILRGDGIDASVINPAGAPTWFISDVPVLPSLPETVTAQDQIVFREGIDGRVQTELSSSARKHIFVQNQYYVFRKQAAVANQATLGIDSVYCCSATIARFLWNNMAIDAPIVPCLVDEQRFFPADKLLQIAYMPRKSVQDAEFVRGAFRAKYPRYADVRFVEIENMTEAETAETLRRSAVFLSFSHRESLGLPPLEAMACGCLVVGMHGEGGLEYATTANGLWHGGDDLLGIVDSLAMALDGLTRDTRLNASMIDAGRWTAARHSTANTQKHLLAYYHKALDRCG